MGAYHSTGYSLKSGVTGDFHRPYGGRVPFIVPPGDSNVAGDFHRPKALVILPFTIYWGVLPRVNWYFIISVWRSRCMTPSAILRMSRDATKARVFSASSRGTL